MPSNAPPQRGDGLSQGDDSYLRLNSRCHSHQDESIFDSSSSEKIEAPRTLTPSTPRYEKPPKIENELALSDVETSKPSRRLPLVTNDIIVVETRFDDLCVSGEVETRSFRAKSPARVVRHSSDSTLHSNSSIESVSRSDEMQQKQTSDVAHTKDLSTDATRKKKKKFLPVQSRYQQAAVKKNECGKPRPLNMSAIAPNPNTAVKKSRVTSTPFVMTSFFENQVMEGNTFDQTSFQQSATTKKPPSKKAVAKQRKNPAKTEIVPPKENKNSLDPDPLTLDIQYARVLQMAYLNRKCQRTFEKQEKKAMQQLYYLWVKNRKLEKEIEAMTVEVEQENTLIEVDKLIDVQLAGLECLAPKLSRLSKKTARLSESLLNTFNYLPTEGITIEDEGSLLDTLNESRVLLADLNSLTRKHQPEMEDLSASCDHLKQTVQLEVLEHKKCAELFRTGRVLVNHERSLQVERMDG